MTGTSSVAAVALVHPVPAMRLLHEGRSYGGQYWGGQDYEVIAEADPGAGVVTVSAYDTIGAPRGGVTYSAEQVRDLAQALHAPEGATPLVPTVADLTANPTWRMPADETEDIALVGTDLETFGAWLQYAAGFDEWDQSIEEFEY